MDALENVMLKKFKSCLIYDRLDLDSAAIGRLARAYLKWKRVPILARITFIEVLLFTYGASWKMVTL